MESRFESITIISTVIRAHDFLFSNQWFFDHSTYAYIDDLINYEKNRDTLISVHALIYTASTR